MPIKPKRVGRPAEIDLQKLLDAAETLFAERGFEGATTRELARRARCNIAMIAYHFGSKDGLYRAVLARYFERIHATFTAQKSESAESERRLWPELEDPDARRICTSIYNVARLLLLDDRVHRILSREMMSGGSRAVAQLKRNDSGAIGPLRNCLEKLAVDGKLRKDLDWRFAILSIMGPLVYSCIAQPVIREIYGFGKIDEDYIRRLSLHLTRTAFEGWRA